MTTQEYLCKWRENLESKPWGQGAGLNAPIGACCLMTARLHEHGGPGWHGEIRPSTY